MRNQYATTNKRYKQQQFVHITRKPTRKSKRHTINLMQLSDLESKLSITTNIVVELVPTSTHMLVNLKDLNPQTSSFANIPQWANFLSLEELLLATPNPILGTPGLEISRISTYQRLAAANLGPGNFAKGLK